MGASMKDIKHRIKSVESTMQITKAMELVASSKLRRAKERAEAARPFFNILYETITDLAGHDEENLYTRDRSGKPPLYIVIAGDRGLAGGYNANIFKLVDPQIEDPNTRIIAIGKKSAEHYDHRPWKVEGRYPGAAEQLKPALTMEMANRILSLYKKGEIGPVYLAFTQFVTPLTQEATLLQVLPLAVHEDETPRRGEPMLYEPSPAAVYRSIIPQYVSGMIYGGIVESYASEQGARRTAMESASNNASDMIGALSLSYNRARQSAITQELTEIVSGANATK